MTKTEREFKGAFATLVVMAAAFSVTWRLADDKYLKRKARECLKVADNTINALKKIDQKNKAAYLLLRVIIRMSFAQLQIIQSQAPPPKFKKGGIAIVKEVRTL